MSIPTVPENKPWSKSALGTLLDGCSWQWALDKVYGQPGWTTPANAIGTAYHTAVEWHEQQRIIAIREGREDTFDVSLADVIEAAVDEYAQEWDEVPDHLPELHEISFDEGWAKVEVAVEAWWDELRPVLMGYRPLMVEPYLAVDHPSSRRGIHGYVDWIGWDPATRTWVVIDHKTAKNFGQWPHGGKGHEVEAGLYLEAAILASQLAITGPIRMEWHIARKAEGSNANFQRSRIVTAELTLDGARKVLSETLSQADAKVDGFAFAPNPDWFLCTPKWCAHFEGCQITGTLSPEVLVG